ncbi:DUF1801 domain-containing protein [Smaragdicoccus niigatensis]|uniref:DUF1801 domain-containing protein n=1 Tax=Smaragdicoccus niigatensis TaxID=359359 RepID=UPI000361D0F8|nr:DUF1801 domain-containing protein [Smaragdicoccus niigatensis]
MSTDWRVALVGELRTLINRAAPGVTEEAKWKKASNPDGVPAFSLGGLICTIETYKDKVKVTFFKGGSLEDPSGLFLPSDGVRRAMDVYEQDELNEDAFMALVRVAAALNQK